MSVRSGAMATGGGGSSGAVGGDDRASTAGGGARGRQVAATRSMTAAGVELVCGMGDDVAPTRVAQGHGATVGSEAAAMLREVDATASEQEVRKEYERARARRHGRPLVGSDTAWILGHIEHAMRGQGGAGALNELENCVEEDGAIGREGEAGPRSKDDKGGEMRGVGESGGTVKQRAGGKQRTRKRQKTVVRVGSMQDSTRWRCEGREDGTREY